MKQLSNAAVVWGGLLIASLATSSSLGQDQLHTFFDGATAGVGDVGGYTFDAAGNFWVAGQGPSTSATIRKITNTGGGWSGDTQVSNTSWAFYYRSDNVPAGSTNPLWSGVSFGTPASFLLNPAPLTITVPNGMGGTVVRTYQPGELAFLSDQQGAIAPTGELERVDVVKRLTRYDLRKLNTPTSVQPDFNNATNGSTVLSTAAFGNVDWNDVFTQVISKEQVATAAGVLGGDSNWGRSFAWSSNGQRLYIIDTAASTGGIYRVDPTTTGSVARIWTDVLSNTLGTRINTEPAIVPTTVRDFAPGNPAVGDQIIVEGSATGGNEGGLNVYTDTGATTVGAPQVIFTEAQFRSFAEYEGASSPQYNSVTSDALGNLFFYEQQTDGLFKYDLQGRMVKVVSEAEVNKFQTANGSSSLANDLLIKMQTRASTAPGFAVTEIVYRDDALDTPVGIYDYKVGDFNRDNSVNSSDYALFSAALGLRGEVAADAELKYDLNANALATNGNTVVDWKDVKILQQFTNIPTGDVNFDSLLNLADLDVMSANYYTLPGQTTETWATGDIVSIDPNYAAIAVDANLVNATDLNLVAQTWVQVLGQPKVTATQAAMQGYTGQFLTDLLAAFAAVGGVPGDYNGNGTVDAADYTIWRDTNGATGTGLAADGDGNLVVNSLDYTYWASRFGNTSSAAAASAVPEPGALATIIGAIVLIICRRPLRGRIG